MSFGIDDEPGSVVAESAFVEVGLLDGGAATRLDGVNKEALDTELFRPEIDALFVSHTSLARSRRDPHLFIDGLGMLRHDSQGRLRALVEPRGGAAYREQGHCLSKGEKDWGEKDWGEIVSLRIRRILNF